MNFKVKNLHESIAEFLQFNSIIAKLPAIDISMKQLYNNP